MKKRSKAKRDTDRKGPVARWDEKKKGTAAKPQPSRAGRAVERLADPMQPTGRQEYILSLIVDSYRQRGIGPSIREIGEQCDIASPNGVMCHLRALVKKGLLRHVVDAGSRSYVPESVLKYLEGLPA